MNLNDALLSVIAELRVRIDQLDQENQALRQALAAGQKPATAEGEDHS